MSESLLDVQGLRAAHGQLVAVRDLGFSIARGEVVALIAPTARARPRCCVAWRVCTPAPRGG